MAAGGRSSDALAALKQDLNLNLHINCLDAENRATRQQALTKFHQMFVGAKATPPPRDVSAELFILDLQAPLLRRFSDQVEKHRDLAIDLVSYFLTKVLIVPNADGVVNHAPINTLCGLLFATLCERLGTTPFAEVSEEVRGKLILLLDAALNAPGTSDAVASRLTEIVLVIAKAAADKDPAVKMNVATAIITLTQKHPSVVHLQLEQLVRSQLPNLLHNRFSVRKACLQAIRLLMPLGAEGVERLMNETVLPALKARVTDRSGPVRKEALELVADWMLHLPRAEEYAARLLSLLILGVADEAPDLQAIALEQLERVGAAKEEEMLKRCAPVPEDAADEYKGVEVLPAGFGGRRPALGPRLLVQCYLSRLLTPLMNDDLAQWTEDARIPAAGQLCVLFALAEANLTAHAPEIFKCLARCAADDSAAVRERIMQATSIVGRFVAPAAIFEVLFPQLRGTISGMNTAQHYASSCLLLAACVRGMTSEQLEPHLPELASVLADPNLASDEAPALRPNLVAALAATVQVATPVLAISPAVVQQLLLVHLHAVAYGGDAIVGAASSALQALVVATAMEREQLYRQHIAFLFNSIVTDAADWSKQSFHRYCLDALVHVAQSAIALVMDSLVPVLRVALNPSKEPDLRLAMLASVKSLLEIVVSVDESASADTVMRVGSAYVEQLQVALQAVSAQLLMDVLLPNSIWKVGRVPGTIRKAAIYCMFLLLQGHLLEAGAVEASLEELQPTLVSCLSDDDMFTRKWTMRVFISIFRMLPGKLTNNTVHALYHELLKRLDDSSNDVRLLACIALSAFAHTAAPEEFAGTLLDYTLESLLVHLDDPEERIQVAVYEALQEWARLNPALGIKKTQEARNRHRSPRFCDGLLAMLMPLAS